MRSFASRRNIAPSGGIRRQPDQRYCSRSNATHAIASSHFFLAPDLLLAIQETAPPLEVDWRNLKLPFHSAAFALPQGGLHRGSDEEVSFLWYSRWKGGETGAYPGKTRAGKDRTVTMGNDGFLLRMVSTRAEYQQVYQGDGSHVLNLMDVASLSFGEPLEGAIPLSADDHTFVAAGISLLFGILFVMLARPNLVESGQNTGKKTQHGSEIWLPNIIGRDFRIAQRGAAATAPGASPRMHWRRGHWRRQPYGPDHSLRRDQWIEPILVAAGKDLESEIS